MTAINFANGESEGALRRATDPLAITHQGICIAWLLLATAMAIGCGQRLQPITKVRVVCPGLSPTECDEQISLRLINAVAGIPGIADRVGFSRSGSVEVYVTWDGTENRAALIKRLDFVANQLPSGIQRPEVSSLPVGSIVPAPESGDEEFMAVELDREKLAALGLSAAAAAGGIRSVIGLPTNKPGVPVEQIQSLIIRADGREVPLRDVATVTMQSQPKCIVRR